MRFKLPPGTKVERKIPKNKFYEKLQAGSSLKELFVEQVDSVAWMHNLSSRTVHLEAAEGIEEIQIFEIRLRQRNCSVEILKAIDRAIPYPILYVLHYADEEKMAIAYKERSGSDENRAVVKSYHETEWAAKADDIVFELLNGLNLKAVYEHIVRSLVLGTSEKGHSVTVTQRLEEDGAVKSQNSIADLPLEELLKRRAHIEALERDCAKLEAQMGREKQFNRKVELNMELQRKRKELKKVKN